MSSPKPFSLRHVGTKALRAHLKEYLGNLPLVLHTRKSKGVHEIVGVIITWEEFMKMYAEPSQYWKNKAMAAKVVCVSCGRKYGLYPDFDVQRVWPLFRWGKCGICGTSESPKKKVLDFKWFGFSKYMRLVKKRKYPNWDQV